MFRKKITKNRTKDKKYKTITFSGANFLSFLYHPLAYDFFYDLPYFTSSGSPPHGEAVVFTKKLLLFFAEAPFSFFFPVRLC
jgi:hypothetical protein